MPEPQFIIDTAGRKKAVILPIKDYELMLDRIEELEDIRLYDEVRARNEPTVPLEEVLKNLPKGKAP